MNTRKPQGIINQRSVIFLFLNNNPHIQMIALLMKKHLPAGGWYVTCFYISAGRSVGPTAASFTIIVCKLRCPQLCPKYFLFPILKHNSGLRSTATSFVQRCQDAGKRESCCLLLLRNPMLNAVKYKGQWDIIKMGNIIPSTTSTFRLCVE